MINHAERHRILLSAERESVKNLDQGKKLEFQFSQVDFLTPAQVSEIRNLIAQYKASETLIMLQKRKSQVILAKLRGYSNTITAVAVGKGDFVPQETALVYAGQTKGTVSSGSTTGIQNIPKEATESLFQKEAAFSEPETGEPDVG